MALLLMKRGFFSLCFLVTWCLSGKDDDIQNCRPLWGFWSNRLRRFYQTFVPTGLLFLYRIVIKMPLR